MFDVAWKYTFLCKFNVKLTENEYFILGKFDIMKCVFLLVVFAVLKVYTVNDDGLGLTIKYGPFALPEKLEIFQITVIMHANLTERNVL